MFMKTQVAFGLKQAGGAAPAYAQPIPMPPPARVQISSIRKLITGPLSAQIEPALQADDGRFIGHTSPPGGHHSDSRPFSCSSSSSSKEEEAAADAGLGAQSLTVCNRITHCERGGRRRAQREAPGSVLCLSMRAGCGQRQVVLLNAGGGRF
jgi:hypothetical protein